MITGKESSAAGKGNHWYSGINEVSSDEIDCSSDDQSDRREQEYYDVDGTSSRPNRSSSFLLKSMITDVKILAADLCFHPLGALWSVCPTLLKQNSRPQNCAYFITGECLVVEPLPKIFHVFTYWTR